MWQWSRSRAVIIVKVTTARIWKCLKMIKYGILQSHFATVILAKIRLILGYFRRIFTATPVSWRFPACGWSIFGFPLIPRFISLFSLFFCRSSCLLPFFRGYFTTFPNKNRTERRGDYCEQIPNTSLPHLRQFAPMFAPVCANNRGSTVIDLILNLSNSTSLNESYG